MQLQHICLVLALLGFYKQHNSIFYFNFYSLHSVANEGNNPSDKRYSIRSRILSYLWLNSSASSSLCS